MPMSFIDYCLDIMSSDVYYYSFFFLVTVVQQDVELVHDRPL